MPRVSTEHEHLCATTLTSWFQNRKVCTHYVRHVPNLNHMTLRVYLSCGSKTSESNNSCNIPEISASQTWTTQQCVCQQINSHFSGRNEGQFGCQTNTHTQDPRSSFESPLQALFIRGHVPTSDTHFTVKHVSRKYRRRTLRSCPWPGGRREARTVQHAFSQTPALHVHVSQMETEPRGTTRFKPYTSW